MGIATSGENNLNWKPPENTCLACGAIFKPKNNTRGRGKYCNNKCAAVGRMGVNAYNWKGGRTPERLSIEERAWRRGVYERDNYSCRECGKRGGSLHAHHVFPRSEYPELRLELWNGVTLCVTCHAKEHPNIGWFKGFVKVAR